MKSLLTVATVIAISATILAFIGRASLEFKSSDIDIGVLACLTTDCAEWGSNAVKGLQLAAKKINASGGVLGRKVALRIQDTEEGKGGTASVSAYRQLVSTYNPKLFVGPSWTPAAQALAPIVSKQNIMMVSPSVGVADFNEAGSNLFNTWPHDEESSKALARYAIEHSWKRAAIFSSQQPWVQSQAKYFTNEYTRLGGEITQIVEPLPSTAQLSSEALKIVNSNPDVILFSIFDHLGTAAKEVRKLNKTIPLFTVIIDDTRIIEASGALEGAIVPRRLDPQEEFQREFAKEFGTSPKSSADTAYDALMLYAKAIDKAGNTDPAQVAAAMKSLEMDGASGKLKFDNNRGVISAPKLFVIKNGAPKLM